MTLGQGECDLSAWVPAKKTAMNRIIALCFFVLIPAMALAAIVGDDTVYNVEAGDTLPLISAKLGADTQAIMRDNGLTRGQALPRGKLLINTRKITPKESGNGIIIDISGRMLYYFESSRIEMSFPVGLGMPKWRDITRWHTPSGTFTVYRKARNPVWHVPESIQMQMKIEGKPVLTRVLPGPDNPLGRYVLYTSIPGVEIHETIAPVSVYRFRSHGCIRVLTEHIVPFFEKVEVGTRGELVYEPVKAAVEGWRVFLQVDPDVYGKVDNVMDEVNDRLQTLNAGAVCWEKVMSVVQEQSGDAEEITLLPTCMLNHE